jgi:flagellar protein FliO/FliZ
MDTAAMVGRLLVSLAAVLGLMWVLARRVKRPGKGKSKQLIDVLSRQQLARNSSIAVVRVMDQALILGMTDTQMTVLGETDLDAVLAKIEAAMPVRATRPAPKSVATARRAAIAPTADVDVDAVAVPQPSGRLAGSALSLATWRQTIESLRDVTARTR